MKIKEYRNKDNSYIMPSEGVFLDDMKKVNIFVGANNSGKSRFMRQIFKSAPDDFVFFDDINVKLAEINDELEPQFKSLFYMTDLKTLISSRTGNYISRFNEFVDKIEKKNSRNSGTGNVWDLDVALAIRNKMLDSDIFKKLEGKFNANIRHVYIPIIRGLRHLDLQNDIHKKQDVYTIRTRADYEFTEEKQSNMDIFSGLTVYSEIRKMLLGTKREREFIAEFQKFISESFFNGKDVTLIPDHDTDNIKLNINNGEEDREIFNLGDGIQSILINTFKIFKHQDEHVVLFIEEPEMMMHPSMQRILIKTLINKFDKLQVFLTTHSNHFLDLTYDYSEDVAIFSFEEVGKEKFKIQNVGNNAKILDLMGVRNSSVFLTNCVIWTEGVTDRMLLRKIIELDSDFKHLEDRHYSFAEYGGSNLENFDFIDNDVSNSVNIYALSRTNFIVADNDNEYKGKKFERRQKLKKLLGGGNVFDAHIEIENLFPYKIWKNAIQNLLKEHPDKDIRLKKPAKNIEAKFNKMLVSSKIGKLLKMIIEKKEGTNPQYFDNNSVQCLGEPKKIIAQYLIKVIDELKINLDDFPQTARNIILAIKSFIASANV